MAHHTLYRLWSHPRDLNSKPGAYEASALPIELGWQNTPSGYASATSYRKPQQAPYGPR